MKNAKLQTLMFAVAGLSMSVAIEKTAAADVGAYESSEILSPSESDLAPVTGNPPRLRRTDQEQPGAEMAHLAFFKGNKTGLYFEMRSGELNGALPNNRIQLAMVPFSLTQDVASGAVKATAQLTGARFVTNNNGDERRNANHPIAFAINDGTAICAEYNYQPNGNNNTNRYIECFDQTGATVLPQTKIYEKNNDNCSMNQDANSTTLLTSIAGKNRLVAWRGCNGNGDDDGWLQAFQLNTDAAGAVTFKPEFDVSLAQREERSRGFCSVSAADTNTAICSWTEGNNQPQRDGTWLAAVDVSPGQTGTNQQATVLWKKQIDGRKGDGDTRTYSMRAMHQRIMAPDATSGNLVASDLIIWRSGDVRGNNNNNNGKGGTYYGNQMAVMKVGKDGMSYVVPLTNVADKLLGLDGTHLGMSTALFGTTDKLTPGIVFLGGSQTGGGYSAKLRTVSVDTTAGSIQDLGSYSIAPYDRHLYPNYLGNNPGNQGRNFAGTVLVANPFVGQNNSKDAYLMITTTTGKSPTTMARPELKLSSFISVLPIAQTPAAPAPADPTNPSTGSGSGSGSGSATNPADPGASTELGGCSTGGGASSLGGILLGLAAMIRRRRT